MRFRLTLALLVLSGASSRAAVYSDLSKGRAPAVLDPRVGQNIRLGDDPDALPATQRGQVEPHIVRSVANPDTLLATFQEGRYFDAGGISCGYAVSHDGGFTWRRSLTPQLTTVTGGRFNRATDPVAGAGPQGDLYLQALASVQGAFSLAAVVVSRSSDGGATWSAPAVVFESTSGAIGPDKNWLAVNDYPGAPNSGRLVSTWTQFLRNAAGNNIASPIVASVSDERGSTWSAPIEITPAGSQNQASQPMFLPDGSLAVIYITFVDPSNASRFRIECKRSSDGGRTFPTPATTVVPLVAGWDDPQLRDGVFLPNVAVARQTGELFVTYTAVVDGTPRIMLTRSRDRGDTWTAPIVVSDQPAGVSVMNPAIAATPDGQSITIVFTDKRLAPEGRDFVDHYAALSLDGGTTWQPNFRVSEVSSEIRFGPVTARGVMLGDYIGIAPPHTSDRPFVAVWCETRTGDADPFVARIAPGGWLSAHFNPGEIASLDSDFDGDGIPNIGEELAGTNPRRADFGDNVTVYRLPDGNRAAAWAVRESLSASAALQVRELISGGVRDFVSRPPLALRGIESVVISELLPGELPPTPLPAGLRWVGAKFAASEPIEVTPTRHVVTGGIATLVISAVGPSTSSLTDSRIINLSTRGRAGTGPNQMIVGFVVDGPKSLLVRAAGPALSALGVNDVLPDPQLTLQGIASDFERSNDNWQQGPVTPALFSRVGALPFAANSRDAALVLDVGAQNYTAVAADIAGRSGIALVEAYDADAAPGAASNSRLLNLSTRGDVGTGENALIAGFVLSGTQPRRILIRAIGPSLARFNVPGVLTDPVLTLYRSGASIATNDDWELSRSPAAVAATAQFVGAFPLEPNSLDAALLVTLSPGAYTAIVSSANNTTGLALVEIYDAD